MILSVVYYERKNIIFYDEILKLRKNMVIILIILLEYILYKNVYILPRFKRNSHWYFI